LLLFFSGNFWENNFGNNNLKIENEATNIDKFIIVIFGFNILW